MKILVIGQCTLQWGRMEFGNIGNYYIIEPFFRLLHETFPGCEISTTFQLSERFCVSENVSVVPMDLYYSWENDLQQAENEFRLAQRFLKDGKIDQTTPYIDLVRSMDLVVDFSGDIWGDNADFLGENRFYVGLLKDRVAQIFAGKTAMIAGSPGPFSEGKNLEFAKEVFKNFDLVTNRENISISVLKSYGFDVSKTYSLTCPAFRFKPAPIETIKKFDKIDKLISENKPSVGFLLCGWNFSEGPFDRWPRNDSEYEVFVSAIERFCVKTGADIYLMSHSNGFPIPPEKFSLNHGRDFPIMQQIKEILENRSISQNVTLLDGVYDAWQTKSILGQFQMVVSGRVHAAVGAMSQNIPTVIIDYGHKPKAHKLRGFAETAGQLDFVVEPGAEDDLYQTMMQVWNNKSTIKRKLKSTIPIVKESAKKNFELLRTII